MFPDPDDLPTLGPENSGGLLIPMHVSCKLLCPPPGIVPWDGPMSWAGMPRATVDEYSNTMSNQRNVDGPAGSRNGAVKAVAKTERPELLSEGKFRLCAGPLLPGQAGTGRRIQRNRLGGVLGTLGLHAQ